MTYIKYYLFFRTYKVMKLLLRISTHLNKSLTRLKITFHKTAKEYFLSSKFDNALSTFFVDDLYQILSLFKKLLGLWQSYIGPQPFWTNPWQDLKINFHEPAKLHESIFWARNLTTFKYFFWRSPISKTISVSEPTRIMTLLLGTSTHLNNPLTRLKISFHETANCTRVFFELEIWQRVKYFFRRWPISNIISVSEPTRNMTLRLRTSNYFNKSLTRLKITFHKTAQEYFLSSKFDNVLGTFFVDDLYQIFTLLQSLLGLWHSDLGPQPIWTSPWQEWKSLFMKLHKSIFWARNLTTC